MEKKLNISTGKLTTYIEINKDNIDYPTYIKKGYIIGSGSIESANKTVLQYRLKQAGMSWNIPNAQDVVTLRAKAESGKWFSDVVEPVYKKYNLKIRF
jgi:hypothetical protein